MDNSTLSSRDNVTDNFTDSYGGSENAHFVDTTPYSPWANDHVVNTFFLICTIAMFFVGTIGNLLVIGLYLLFYIFKCI